MFLFEIRKERESVEDDAERSIVLKTMRKESRADDEEMESMENDAERESLEDEAERESLKEDAKRES